MSLCKRENKNRNALLAGFENPSFSQETFIITISGKKEFVILIVTMLNKSMSIDYADQ